MNHVLVRRARKLSRGLVVSKSYSSNAFDLLPKLIKVQCLVILTIPQSLMKHGNLKTWRRFSRALFPNRPAKILLSKLFNRSTGGTSHPFFTYENLAYQNPCSDNHRKRHRVSSYILLPLT